MNIELCQVKHYQEIDKLKQHPDNPRSIEPERLDLLKRSILKKGFYQPILVWKRGNIILSGNHRFLAVQELMLEGYTFNSGEKKNVLPVVVVDCSKAEALNILLEANNSYAHWVEDQLAKALKGVEDVQDTGFSTDFIDKLLKTSTEEVEKALADSAADIADIVPEKIEPGPMADEDSVPAEPKKVVTKPGDVWVMGNHKLICGDSTDINNYDSLLGKKKKASAVFTSPPYNAFTHLDYNKGGNKELYSKKRSSDKRTPEEYISFLQEVLSNLFATTTGFIFWNVSYSANDRSSYLKVIHPYLDSLHETIIWEKKPMPVPHGLTRATEFVFCFKNGGKRDNLGEPNTLNYNLWKISNRGAQEEDHKACFPVLLPETGILLSTSEGDIVLEPFSGSGSTIIACEKTKRKCYAIELEPRFCDLAVTRWEKFTGKTAYLESSGQLFSDMK